MGCKVHKTTRVREDFNLHNLDYIDVKIRAICFHVSHTFLIRKQFSNCILKSILELWESREWEAVQGKLLKDIKIVRGNWGTNQDHRHVTMYSFIIESLLKMLWLSAMHAYTQRRTTIFLSYTSGLWTLKNYWWLSWRVLERFMQWYFSCHDIMSIVEATHVQVVLICNICSVSTFFLQEFHKNNKNICNLQLMPAWLFSLEVLWARCDG